MSEMGSPEKRLVTDTGVDAMGEVQATPTAYTLLRRLKDLLTGIVISAGSAIIGKVGIDQTTPGTTNGVQVNAALPTGTNVIGKTGHDITGIGDGRKTVTTPGTAEALASSTSAKVITITAETDNTDVVCVGGSTVVEADATRRGTPLYAGESVTLLIDNLADVYIDAAVAGEGVTYTYLT